MKHFLFILSAFLIISCQVSVEKLKYPVTKKGDVVDDYFGTSVADPYRWLENDTAKETANWVEAQNELTFNFLEKIPYRQKIRDRLNDLFSYERLSAPFKEGDYYYFYKNDGLQNHSIVYRMKEINGDPEVFLNPNTFSEDGTSKLSGLYFSQDGSLAAYQISEGGADWNDAVVIRTANQKLIGDTIRNIKFSRLSWKGNEGFFYSTYGSPEGSKLSAKTDHHILYFHKIGTRQTDDVRVFGKDSDPRRYVGGYLTEDERYLIIEAAKSTTGNELYIKDLSKNNSPIIPIVNNFDNEHSVIGNTKTNLLIKTNLNAPNSKVVSAPISSPTPDHWTDLIPETKDVLSVSTAGGKIFAQYLVDVKTQVKQFNWDGTLDREIELPGIGTAFGFYGKESDTEVFYSFTSFTYPPTIFQYNITDGSTTLYKKPDVKFDPEQYETEQVFYASKDGTKIPMFIVYKKGLKRNGKNPTLLYGYGGFSISLRPTFSTSLIVWLDNGGVYAQPNLRGGGEYGESWHLAGTQLNKQNVFDDFIAAGEFLIKEEYTSSEYLALRGGSNGGLLVGAVMAQRPELAKVALPAVGVMDMLRYHKFTAGAGWAYDYGTSEDSKEMFEYLRKYSPLHALKPAQYPATLVTTADHDDRVVPAHSFKFAATLQEHQQGVNPTLIRIDTKSGHGSSNLSKSLEVLADQYAFALYCMGIKSIE